MKVFLYVFKITLLSLLFFYQNFISPVLPRSCRFYPSCSQYCKIAIQKYGVVKGLLLSAKRLLKCNSLFKGGEDHVP